MKLIKVASAVLSQTPLDWAGNTANILGAIEAARAQNVKILCLPEMSITGYGCEDAFHSPGLQHTALEMLREILPSTHGMIVSLGLPLLFQNGLFNAACLAADGKILGFAAKRFLAGDGIHYEPRWFKPWPLGVRAEIGLDGAHYPLGDIYFDCGGVRIGFEICEDAWVAKRPGASLALDGVDVILNPSASHFAFGKSDVRKRFVTEGSRAFGVTYLYSNLLGNEAGRVIYDGGALVASGGRLLAAGPRFSFANFCVTSAVADIEATRMCQARTASFMPDIGDSSARAVRAEFLFPEIQFEQPAATIDAWECGSHVKEEEFTRAVTLGLFDYMRKSHVAGFVVSFSGGADSAAVSCLVALAIERVEKELGHTEFLNRLRYLKTPKSADRLSVKDLLTCVYQAAAQSSASSREASKRVADAIGANFIEWNISRIVEEYADLAATALGRAIEWKSDDIALQNIQARARAPGVWMLANIKNALLLATSDRSEAAVGYATMDGDTCGGLAPIAGIDKFFLKRWLRWMETEGPDGSHAIPELSIVNAQTPTPELRPQTAQQTAEGDLMPYELLDAVERTGIRDKKTPLEIFQVMRVQFPQFSVKQLTGWIERFFLLWARNQWKRERYAPSFHLDDENLDPKTWCRFPILSGGFERELAEMREKAK